jgi:hypothetical protein
MRLAVSRSPYTLRGLPKICAPRPSTRAEGAIAANGVLDLIWRCGPGGQSTQASNVTTYPPLRLAAKYCCWADD